MSFKLSGSGIRANLYHFLWIKSSFSDRISLTYLIPLSVIALRTVYLPDTVVFKYQRPVYWYFRSLEGTILRRSEAKLTPEHIFASFTSNKHTDCEILATYFYTKGKCVETFKSLIGFAEAARESMPDELRQVTQGSKRDVVVEFLDEAALSMHVCTKT